MEYQEWLRVAKTQPQNELYTNIAKYSQELIFDAAFRSQGLIAKDLGLHQSNLSNLLRLLKAQAMQAQSVTKEVHNDHNTNIN